MAFIGKTQKKHKFIRYLKLLEEEKYAEIKRDMESNDECLNDPVCLTLLGECFLALGEKDRALEFFRKAIEKDPLNSKVSLNIFMILEEQGEEKKAYPFLRRTVALFPWREDLMDKLRSLDERGKESFKLPGATPELKELFEAIEKMGERESLRWFRDREEKDEGEDRGSKGEAR